MRACLPFLHAPPRARLPLVTLRGARCVADIGKAFIEHYYQTFDTARVNLQTLYQDGSMLTFENEQFMGMQAIMTKLTVRARARRRIISSPA